MNNEKAKAAPADLIEQFCVSDDLRTYDPYDIWKTRLGIKVKHLFNTRRMLAALPALTMALFDLLINNRSRRGYQKQEYPIARAYAAQILLRQYQEEGDLRLLRAAKTHLDWLAKNYSRGYGGHCWGIGFEWPAFDAVVYDAQTPHATHTPYVLEAFHQYHEVTGEAYGRAVMRSAFQFYEKDLFVLYEDHHMMATSYGPFPDKLVNNAVSYTLYMYTLFLEHLPEKQHYIEEKIRKLYRFVADKQRPDGSWLYSPDDPASFIDCFHSCIVVKNLLKASQSVSLEGVDAVIQKGYDYIIHNFYDARFGLFKRFTLSNKLSLTKFDLYDNAEVLNLALMMGELEQATALEQAIRKYFVRGKHVYSMIDFLGYRRNKNTLRWAVMPYLFALTTLQQTCKAPKPNDNALQATPSASEAWSALNN